MTTSQIVSSVASEEFPPAGLGPLTPYEEVEAARGRLSRARQALVAAEAEWLRQRDGYIAAMRTAGVTFNPDEL